MDAEEDATGIEETTEIEEAASRPKFVVDGIPTPKELARIVIDYDSLDFDPRVSSRS